MMAASGRQSNDSMHASYTASVYLILPMCVCVGEGCVLCVLIYMFMCAEVYAHVCAQVYVCMCVCVHVCRRYRYGGEKYYTYTQWKLS